MRVKCAKKHLEMCSELEGEDSLDIVYSYHRLATAYFEMNEPKEAISCLEKALSILLKMDKKNNPLLKMMHKNMGSFYSSLSDYKKAKEQYDKASKIKAEEYDVKVNFYDNISEVYTYMNNYEKAEEVCNKALKEIQKEKSVQSRSKVDLYVNIGVINFFKGDYEAAKRNLNEALNKLNEHGKQNSLLIIAYSVLGTLDGIIGNFDQAIKTIDKGLSISLETYGEMNINTASLYLHKGIAYANNGDSKRGIELLNKSLNISLHMFGPQNELTLVLYSHLGKLYCEIGDFIKAKSNCLKALDIAIKLFKEENITHSSIYNGLGTFYLRHKGNIDKAIHYFDKGLKILSKVYGKNHPSLLETYLNLASGYHLKKNFQKTIELCNIALEILLGIDAKKSMIYGSLCLCLGDSYFKAGNEELGITYVSESSKTFLSIYDSQHPFVLAAYSLLAQMYQTKGDHVRALKMTNKVLKIHENIAIGGDIFAILRYMSLGYACNLKEDYSNAKAAFEKALEISLNVYGELHSMTGICLTFLGRAYEDLDEIKKAEECLNKALSILLKTSHNTDYIDLVYSCLANIYMKTGRCKEASYALYKIQKR